MKLTTTNSEDLKPQRFLASHSLIRLENMIIRLKIRQNLQILHGCKEMEHDQCGLESNRR